MEWEFCKPGEEKAEQFKSMSENKKIWALIKNSSTKLHKKGINPIDILRWSQNRTLEDVQMKINEAIGLSVEVIENQMVKSQKFHAN